MASQFGGRSMFDRINMRTFAAQMARQYATPQDFSEASFRNAFDQDPKERAALTLYEQQFPAIREFQCAMAMSKQLIAEMGHIETNLPVFDHQTMKGKEGFDKVRQSIKVMEETLKSYRAMTALANALAVGRKKLDQPGNHPAIPVIRLSPDTATKKAQKTKRGTSKPSQQAQLYAAELQFVEKLIPKWEEAADRFREKEKLEEPTDVIWPHAQKAMDEFRRQQNLMQPSSHTIEHFAVSKDASETVRMDVLARKMPEKKPGKVVLSNFTTRLSKFADEWELLQIWLPTNGGLPAETLLAFSASHVRAIKALEREGEKLLKSSIQLEKVLERIKLIGDKHTLELPLCSFDLESPKTFHDELLQRLGPKNPSTARSMQKYQSDKLKKALETLGRVRQEMQTWLATNAEDPAEQGIHLPASYQGISDLDKMPVFADLKLDDDSSEAVLEAAVGKEERKIFRYYEKQWPIVKEYQATFVAAKNLMNHSGLAQDGYPIFDNADLPATSSGHTKVLQAVKILEAFFEAHASMTALVSGLALGRLQVDHSGSVYPPVPVLRLRSADAFHKTIYPKFTEASIFKGMDHQAEAYMFELDWLDPLVDVWRIWSERWDEILPSSTQPVYPHWDTMIGEYRRKYGSKRMVEVSLDYVASVTGSEKEVQVVDIAKLLPSEASASTVIEAYVNRLSSFSEQYNRLSIQVPVSAHGASETVLAFSNAHAKLISTTCRQGKKLIKAATHLESILGRAAKEHLFGDDNEAVSLPLVTFDHVSAIEYRDSLLKHLGPHKTFHPAAMMPQLLQRWQVDQLEQAVANLSYLEKSMKTWVNNHGNDYSCHGIHIDVDKGNPGRAPRLDTDEERDYVPEILAMVMFRQMDGNPATRPGKDCDGDALLKGMFYHFGMLVQNVTGVPWNEALATATNQAWQFGDRALFKREPSKIGDDMYNNLANMVLPTLLRDHPEGRESKEKFMNVVMDRLSPDGNAEHADE